MKTPVPFLVDELPTFKRYRIKSMFDLGCGVGRNGIFLAKAGFAVVCIDISESALGIANAWVRKEGLTNVKLARGTMTDLPFNNGCFDAVISISVIHHALKKDIEQIIAEVYRTLRKSGLFFVNIASVEDPRYGEGEEVEENTFRILEAFEEKRFEELHHFFTKRETSEMFARFNELDVELLSEKPNYWKITAIK